MSTHPQEPQTPDQAPDSTAPYDPEQDPDSDPEMLTSQHPALQGENERDPAEGPDQQSPTDG